MTNPFLGIVVSHTHWDRAWYLPFQTYRHRLVRLIDAVLDILESDACYRAFMLDGQTVLLEDYLAIRPQNINRIKAFVQENRIQIGPWYTLPDLFLPSGEAIVRNLQMGRNVSLQFGTSMAVGYVPDPFGHFAQLPQVLMGFGLDSFLFMRGACSRVKELGSIFNWVAPDGSSVLAVYLQQGYLACSALGHPSQFGRFDGHVPSLSLAQKRVEETVEALQPLQKERTLLLLNGCDHMPPQPEIPEILCSLEKSYSNAELRHGTLQDFVNSVRAEGFEHLSFSGDLIGNADHPILLSVYSTRMHLKQQNHCAQSLLTRVSEPLSCFVNRNVVHSLSQNAFFDEAWKILLRNQAHDNICGCSVDEVHSDDESRFAECLHIANALVTENLESLCREGLVAPSQTGALYSDVFVFNPHPFAVVQRVEVSVLFPNPEGEWAKPTPERDVLAVCGDGKSLNVQVLSSEPRVARSAFLETTWGRRYKLAFDVALPAMGYNIVHVFESAEAPRAANLPTHCVVENEFYEVSVQNGRLSIFEKATQTLFPDALSFEFEQDMGDTYSFSEVPDANLWHADLVEVSRCLQHSQSLQLRFQLQIPEHYDAHSLSVQSVSIDIHVRASLSASRGVGFSFEYTNTVKDGRLRALFATNTTAKSFVADGHFRLAERENCALAGEPRRPYPGEIPYNTHHQGDFSFVRGENSYRVWVANRGNPEVALAERKGVSQFAITLHRSVGYLSVYGGSVRQCQAGPQIPTPGAQCLRAFRHAFMWGAGRLEDAHVVRECIAFSHPFYVCEMPFLPYLKSGVFSRSQKFLSFDNPNILLSACKPVGEKGVSLRFYNISAVSQSLSLQLNFNASRWVESSLDEMWSPESERTFHGNTVEITISPHEIRTILVS
jgi:mannosylglycerate hydrolase